MNVKKDSKTGKWFFRVDVGKDPRTGKRKQKYHGSFPTKKAVLEALANIQAQVNEGSYLEPSMEDFHVYMNRWFETVYRRSVEITTVESRHHFLDKHILNYFNHQKLSDIDTFAIDEFYEFCSEEGFSPATIKIVHSLLNQAFKKAVKWRLMKINPVADSSPPPIKNSKVKNLWTKEETNRFLQVVNDQGVSSIYVTAIFTGMHRGENLGIKWSDIDFAAKTIHVQRSLTRTKSNGLILKDVKTKSSNRIIVISDYVLEILRERKAEQKIKREKLGHNYTDNDLVNCTDDGKPIDPRNLLRQFYRLLEEADVPKITLHDLRHLHATVLMALGENPKVVSERLDHNRVQVTLDTYSHVSHEMQRNSSNRFEDAILQN